MKKVELLAPAGDMEKFYTALHFGADAVYLAGKQFGLRAYAGNFDVSGIAECCKIAHSIGKKVYVTVNIYAKNEDFDALPQYLSELYEAEVDAILVSDPGILQLAKAVCPKLELHLSTQANTTNMYSARFWAEQGVKRIVVARESSLEQIKQIAQFNPNTEIEAFCHGAMCISYSGRCLLSDFLTDRASNRGECVQACRWKYGISLVGGGLTCEVLPENKEEKLLVSEDERGTYLFNSKDLNTLPFVAELIESGITSLKIEGRMKSPYYVATVVNSYRRAIDAYYNNTVVPNELYEELNNASHRSYTSGFFFGQRDKQFYPSSRATGNGIFTACVLDWQDGVATVEMRNRFKVGDCFEILSANDSFGKSFVVETVTNANGESIDDVKVVQEIVKLNCPYPLEKFDILRKNS